MDRVENYGHNELRFTKPITRAEIASAGVGLSVDLDCDEALRAVAIIHGNDEATTLSIVYGVEARGASLADALAGQPETWRLISVARNGSGRPVGKFPSTAERLFSAEEVETIEAERDGWQAEFEVTS